MLPLTTLRAATVALCVIAFGSTALAKPLSPYPPPPESARLWTARFDEGAFVTPPGATVQGADAGYSVNVSFNYPVFNPRWLPPDLPLPPPAELRAPTPITALVHRETMTLGSRLAEVPGMAEFSSEVLLSVLPLGWPLKCQAAKTVGSGPARGFLEVSDAYSSSRAVQNFGSARPTDFIFDAQSQRFIMGRGPLGHDSVLQAGRITPSQTTVGGRIFRQDGQLITDEWSGHYGQNWTPERRQQFQSFMQQHGVGITHTPWGQ